MNQSVTQTPYKEFSSIGTTAVEQVVPATVAGGATATIASFLTPSGVPNTTVIPQGLWQLFLHFNAGSAGQNWIIRPYVYKRDLGGTETLIFTPDPDIVTNMSTTTTMYTCDGVFPTTTLLTTDRIVVKIDLQNTTGVSQTANFRTEGSQHYSVATTTLNQAVPTGGVTSVTGTAPVVSSGGTTPAISIADAVADGTTKGAASFTSSDFNSSSGNISIDYTNGQAASASNKGFLTSTDWTTFNGKQNAITLTTTGTSGASTLVGSTLNIPQYAGGLTYFTEAQNTTAPNATVPVDSLTAVSAATNADFALIPKGTGSILAAVPNNAAGGGNKRGPNAVDLQTSRTTATQVASGDNAVIAGGQNNTSSGPLATVGGGTTNVSSNYRTTVSGGISNTASGIHATVGGGYNNVSSGEASFTVGEANTASGSRAVAIGQSNTASSTNSVAIGKSNIANAIQATSIGTSSTASGTNSTAIGNNATASGLGSVAIGTDNTRATGDYSVVLGYNHLASAQGAYCLGIGSTSSGFRAGSYGNACTASGEYSHAMGNSASTIGISGRYSYASGAEAVVGDSQASKFILRERTTGAFATALTTDSLSASTNNQVILSNQSAYRFKGTIIGKQSGSTNVATWDVDGLIVRGANAASTTLVVSNVNLVSNASSWGTPTLSADPFNGGLQIQVTGAAATNIQWVATIETTEVIYA
jgi:hypothetical protein